MSVKTPTDHRLFVDGTQICEINARKSYRYVSGVCVLFVCLFVYVLSLSLSLFFSLARSLARSRSGALSHTYTRSKFLFDELFLF